HDCASQDGYDRKACYRPFESIDFFHCFLSLCSAVSYGRRRSCDFSGESSMVTFPTTSQTPKQLTRSKPHDMAAKIKADDSHTKRCRPQQRIKIRKVIFRGMPQICLLLSPGERAQINGWHFNLGEVVRTPEVQIHLLLS